MIRPKARSLLEAFAFLGILGTAMATMSFSLNTPAEALEEHIVEFDEHKADDVRFRASQANTTVMVEAQTRLMCLRTGVDTLAMLGVVSTCDSLGVPR